MRIDLLHKSQMNLGTVQDGKAVPATLVLARGKTESLVMRKGGAEITDWEDRRHSLQDSHERKPYPDRGIRHARERKFARL